MTYGVSVVYAYVNDVTDDYGMKSDILEVDFRPNTPKGLVKIIEILQQNHPRFRKISILNLIPLANDPKEHSEDEDDME